MSKNDAPVNPGNDTLSEEELMLLSSDPATLKEVDPDSSAMKTLRTKIMSQVDEQISSSQHELLTIRADAGDWQDVSDKIRKKILHFDEITGLETYLLKIEPGARDAPHLHTSDEHCIVLEGDVTFGELHLNAGDYHLAKKGSTHAAAYSVDGALLYIQTGVEHSVPA